MQIYFLDRDPEICAQYHPDRQMISQIKESVQLLCTACRHVGIRQGYKIVVHNTFLNNWLLQSYTHWEWLRELTYELEKERRFRFSDKKNSKPKHMSIEVIERMPEPKVIPDLGWLNDPPLVMPDQYKMEDHVESYRNYLNLHKRHTHQWTKRERPFFITDTVEGDNI